MGLYELSEKMLVDEKDALELDVELLLVLTDNAIAYWKVTEEKYEELAKDISFRVQGFNNNNENSNKNKLFDL